MGPKQFSIHLARGRCCELRGHILSAVGGQSARTQRLCCLCLFIISLPHFISRPSVRDSFLHHRTCCSLHPSSFSIFRHSCASACNHSSFLCASFAFSSVRHSSTSTRNSRRG